MEMMHHEAGVHTVAAGGLPSNGPMQTPSGSRGAQAYSFENLDTDIEFAKESNATAGNFLPERQEDVFFTSAFFNLRDQVRKGESTPLQFVYEAANCRIFYTKDTVYNFGKLWRYAANAIWTNPELCVQGSTGIASHGNSSNISGPPAGSPSVNPNIIYNMTTILELSGAIHEDHPDLSTQQLDSSHSRSSSVGDPCILGTRNNDGCGGLTCEKFNVCGQTKYQCARTCSSSTDCNCIFTKNSSSSSKNKKERSSGHCDIRSRCDTIAHANYDPDAPLPFH